MVDGLFCGGVGGWYCDDARVLFVFLWVGDVFVVWFFGLVLVLWFCVWDFVCWCFVCWCFAFMSGVIVCVSVVCLVWVVFVCEVYVLCDLSDCVWLFCDVVWLVDVCVVVFPEFPFFV